MAISHSLQRPERRKRTAFFPPNMTGDTIEARGSGGDHPETEERSGNAAGNGAGSARTRQDILSRAGITEAVIANIGEGLCITDQNGLAIVVNPAAERMLGWTQDELKGKAVHEVIGCRHSDASQASREDCPLREALANGERVADRDAVCLRKNGSHLQVNLSISPVVEGGDAEGLIVIFRDAADRSLVETRLRESEERFAKFMQNLPGLAWIKDGDGRYIFANDAAEKAFSRKLSDLYGKTDFEVFPDEIAAQFVANDEKAVREGALQTIEKLEHELGDLRHSIVKKFPIPVDNGRRPMVGGIAIDITEQKRVQEHQDFLFSVSEMIRVSRNAEELLASISDALGRYLNLHRCLFNEIDLANDTETVHRDYSRTGESVAGRHKVSDYSPISSESMEMGRTVVNRDSRTDPRTAELFDTVYGPNKEIAYVTVPMLRNGKWVASLWCSDDRPRNWAAQEVTLLENIAERTWGAIERLRAEQLQTRNREMFSTLVEAAPFGVYFIDADFRLISVNSGAAAVFSGIDPLIGRDFSEIVRIVWPEPFATVAIEKFRHTLETGETYVAPTVTEPRGNADVVETYDWQIHRITLSDGSYGVVCYFYDLTNQKRLEAAVRTTAEMNAFRLKLSDTLRKLDDPADIQDKALRALGEYLGANRVGFAEASFEYEGLIVNRDFTDGVPSLKGLNIRPEDDPALFAELRGGSTLIRPDIKNDTSLTEERKAEYVSMNVGAAAGVPLIREGRLAAVLFVHCRGPHRWNADETALIEETAERAWTAVERARAEEAMRVSEEKFRTIFESIDEGFVILEMIFDDDGNPYDYRFTEANPAFTRLTGLPENALGRTARELVPNLERFWFETYGKVALTGESVRFEHYSEPMRRWFDVYATRVGDEESRRVALVFDNVTERKEIERALRGAEERYRGLLNQSVAGVAEIDLTGNLMNVNDRYCEIVGRSREELLTLNLQDLNHPDDQAENAAKVRRLIQTGENFDLEKRYVRPDGSWVWVYNSVFAVSSLDGRPYSIVAVVIDITERKYAEEALRASEERYRAVVESQSEMLCRFRLDGTILFVNRSYADAVGASVYELMNGTFWEFIPEDDRVGVREMLYSLSLQNPQVQIENRLETVNGPRWVLWTNRALVFDDAGVAVEAQCSGIDITDRKLAEQKLRESEERFSKAFKASPLVLTISSLETGKLLEVNETFVSVTGYSREEAIGRTTLELGLWAKPPEREAELEMVRTRGHLSNVEYVFRTRDGGHIVGLLSAEKVEIAGTPCALTVIQDITDRKRAAEKLRESEERFRLATEAVQAVIYDWNIVEDTIERSSEVERLLGFGPDDPETHSNAWWRTRLHPDDAAGTIGSVERAIQSGEMRFEEEYRILHRDGGYIWVSDVGRLIRDGSGRAVRCVGSVTDITQRKQAEAALRESQERLQLAQMAGNVGVWDWDIAADKTYWSDTMWTFYGADVRHGNPDDEYWTSHLHDEDRPGVKERLFAALKSDAQNYRDEFRVRTEDGSVRWLETIANIIRDAAGTPVRMYGVNIDITERKLGEDRIRRSENQLRLVTNSAPALIAYIDRNFRYQFVNERYSEWFAIPADKIIGQKVRDILGEQALKTVRPMMMRTLAGEPVSYQTTLNYKTAGRKYVQVSYIPDTAEDGSVRGLYSLVNDLTEWKRSEELLRSSEMRVAMLMESVADYAIFSTDTAGRIETWNIGAENIFGYPLDEAVGKHVSMLYPAEDVESGAPAAEIKTARRRGKASDERWLVRKDGSRFFASGVMRPLRIGRTVNGFVKIVSDLTEKKRRTELLQSAHDELELRVRDRTRDLATVNEALRNEIEERQRSEAVKIGLLHRIVSAQEAERQRIARDIHDQLGQRLTALRLKLAALHEACQDGSEMKPRVERLQEIAHLLDSEVSFLASELRPNTLDDLGLEEALRAHAVDWSRHYDIVLDFHSNGLAGKRLERETEIQLYRIAQEALNNVAKHSKATKVNVLLEKAADALVLIIEDDGVGFTVPKRASGKTGSRLGLVGMNERAALIGAAIEIESMTGKGSTVFVRLPTKGRGDGTE